MRKYYLFLMRDDIIDIYKDNYLELYNGVKRIYQSKSDINYQFSIYRQLCLFFATNIIKRYLESIPNVIFKNNKYLVTKNGRNCLIELNRSCIVLVTSSNIPDILKVLYYYNRNIFICDFDNDDYFWISDYYSQYSSINHNLKTVYL